MSLWLMLLVEFYKQLLASKHWTPELQAMAYRNMDLEGWALLGLFFLASAIAINFLFVLLWTGLIIMKRLGFIADRGYRNGTIGFKAAIAIGCLAAMIFTNNLWVEIAN